MPHRHPFHSGRRAALLGLAGSAAGVAFGPFASLAHAAAETTAIAPRRGGRLTLLVNPEPNVLINFATTAGAEQKASPKVTEGLLSYDFNVRPQPQLATAWTISADGLQYTFKLRQGVRWHDGQPFTSKDVATSIGLLKQYHSRGRSTFANVVEVRTPDPHTALLQLSRPAPYLIYALAASESPIVPAHLYDSGDPLNNPHNIAPIGTGPFRFKSWERGSHVVLVRNPDYWDAPKPYIDELVLRFIGDPAARAVALETGELDLAGENPVPLLDIQRLQALPHLALESRGYSYDAAQTQLQFNLDNRYLANPKVRQAIAHTIDREAILRAVWYGYGIVAPSPISPLLTQFYDPHAPTWPHDPAKANQLLDEAGLPRQSNGYRFALNVDYNPYDPTFARLADYLRQTLRGVGIEATVRSQDFGAYVKRIYTDRDFDLDANFLGNTFDPTVGVQRLYWSKNFRKGVPFSNATHYSNPEVDRLLEAAAVENDPRTRVAYFRQFQQVVGQDLPIVDLVTLKQVTIYNRRVHNHTVTADGLDGNLADVFVA
ncbi:ABC transporter substrate-binding protein [Paraburkholderia phenazinium]|jgi:peptide/nickel transport system substrate-binding protein|uniref:Peptide/nickel transport system substrate-binding protein n=1 Tax=Paraburkholderia phenazinium TaxID=60549 RepID=A0A1N6I484_9BURK|nr:ABC transporter substrate-binding protein [Paraburkholderia phenazinium]SIO26725.1 peptide/nickel transport system substrate-binding protein [Paraburkholderia phenazinium]